MKKCQILLLLLLSITTIGIAQEDESTNLNEINNKKHELRIDAFEALIVPALDLSYEYVLSRYSGVGATINLSFQENDGGGYVYSGQKFAFTPYFRQYFFNRKDYGARGFFAEGFLQYTTGEDGDFAIDSQPGELILEEENWSAFGIGFAVGQKWVSRNGFVLELSIGGGRNLTDDDFAPNGFFRGGVSIGYRF